MRNILKYVGGFAGVIVIILILLYFNNDIGTYKSNIEKDARVSQKIPTDWGVCKDATETMVSMLFYDNSLENHTFSIYVNRKGLSYGYFFRGGDSLGIGMDEIIEFNIEGYNESVYMSMNKQQISKVDIDNGNTIETIDIDSTKPFTLILPVNAGFVTIYDINGNIVESTFGHL